MKNVVGALLLAMALLSPGAASAEVFKHSGSIVEVDRDAGILVLAEVGPWRIERGAMAITLLKIEVAKGTEFALVYRVAKPPTGFAGDFVEQKLEPWDVFHGDVVTITCVHHGGRMIATKVTVVEPDGLETP